MSPSQLQAKVIIDVIAISRAPLRRDTPAEGERGRTGREAVPGHRPVIPARAVSGR
jgi:hypothetical protein